MRVSYPGAQKLKKVNFQDKTPKWSYIQAKIRHQSMFKHHVRHYVRGFTMIKIWDNKWKKVDVDRFN